MIGASLARQSEAVGAPVFSIDNRFSPEYARIVRDDLRCRPC